MIDTHTHLYSEEFDDDFCDIIQRANDAGINKFIFPAIEQQTFERMFEKQQMFNKQIFMAIGLHPTSVTEKTYKRELDFVEKKLEEHNFIAVGEIGIDCYWTIENIKYQRFVFERQLELASKKNMPVIIHARNSFDEIFSILKKRADLQKRGVFHAFSGTFDQYLEMKKVGDFLVGIGGAVTFKNSGVKSAVKEIPINKILLETDSPYLSPTPFRGKRNESGYLPIIAKKIAEIKNISYEEVVSETTKNAEKLFAI